MQVREAKDFLVQQTAEQAALENVPLSGLEKRMMYFTETGECPEDPVALNDAFEAEYDTTAYENKISLLLAQAYRRIERENPEKLRLWNNAFSVLSKGDHYLLVFWRQNALSSKPPVSMPAGKSPRMWPTYVALALALASVFSLLFLFGNRRGMRRGEQAPIDKYIPSLTPVVQHALQLLFLLGFLLAVFPQLFSKLASLLRGFLQSALLARRQK